MPVFYLIQALSNVLTIISMRSMHVSMVHYYCRGPKMRAIYMEKVYTYPLFTRTAKIGLIFVVRPKKIGKFLSFLLILCNRIRFWLFV